MSLITVGLTFLEVIGLVSLIVIIIAAVVFSVKRFRGAAAALQMVMDHESKGNQVRKEAAKSKVIPGGKERILLVDDEPLVLKVQSNLLASLGYETITMNSGEEAVDYLQTNDVDLLLLDLLMEPGIDGVETFRRIRKFKPSQKAVVLTGYATPAQVKEVRDLGAGAYLIKPVPLSMLAQAIRHELDGVQEKTSSSTQSGSR